MNTLSCLTMLSLLFAAAIANAADRKSPNANLSTYQEPTCGCGYQNVTEMKVADWLKPQQPRRLDAKSPWYQTKN